MAAAYIPVLVGKRGEFDALRTLPDSTRELLRPIFDLAPIAPDKDPADIIDELVRRVGQAFPNGGAPAVDLLGLDGRAANGTHPIDHLLTRSAWSAAGVELAVRTDASPSYIAAVKEHHGRSDGVCIRARVKQDSDPDELAARVAEILELLDLRPPSAHLCFDCGRITDWPPRPDRVIAEHLRACANLTAFRVASVAATNVPPNDQIRREERPMRVPRREWTAWQRLSRSGFPVVFGDYGITGPRPDIPPKGLPAPHLRYTTGSALLIWRGQRSDLITEEDEGQPTSFRDLCEELMEHDGFALEGFSEGDRAFASVAAGQRLTKAGEPTDGIARHWVEWATNHHVAHVVSELAG